jgi:GTP-binding protein
LKIRSLKVACTTLDPARFPNSPWAEVAVAGRSNVGKSSLLNTLFERKNYARISKDPGKTRTVKGGVMTMAIIRMDAMQIDIYSPRNFR